MNADTGDGVVIMVNSDNGISLANHIVRRIAKEYAWNYKLQPDNAWDELFCERYANHRLVTRGRAAIEAGHSSEVANLPLVGQPIG